MNLTASKPAAVADIDKSDTNRIMSLVLKIGGALLLIYIILKLLGLPSSITLVFLNIPVEFNLLVLGTILLFWGDSNVYIRKYELGLANETYARASLAAAISVILSVAVHELAHGLVSQLMFGNPIAEAGFTFWGAYVLPTESIFEMSPLAEVAIALAGPLANVVLGYIALVFVWHHGESLMENTVQYFGAINFKLAKLNMIPFIIFLDGGKVMHGIVRMFPNIPEGSTTIAQIMLGLIVFYGYRQYMKGKKPIEERLTEI